MLFYLLYSFKRYYIFYIVCIIEKNKYSFLQHKSVKYILSIHIILIKIKNKFNQHFIKTNFYNLYVLTQQEDMTDRRWTSKLKRSSTVTSCVPRRPLIERVYLRRHVGKNRFKPLDIFLWKILCYKKWVSLFHFHFQFQNLVGCSFPFFSNSKKLISISYYIHYLFNLIQSIMSSSFD